MSNVETKEKQEKFNRLMSIKNSISTSANIPIDDILVIFDETNQINTELTETLQSIRKTIEEKRKENNSGN